MDKDGWDLQDLDGEVPVGYYKGGLEPTRNPPLDLKLSRASAPTRHTSYQQFRSGLRRISIVERIFGREPTDETLESFGEKRNAIIPLLIDMDDRGLAIWAAFAVVETYHVVASRWAIGEVDPDVRVASLFDPKRAAAFAAERISLAASNRKDSGDRDVVLSPCCAGGTADANLTRRSPILVTREFNVSRWHPVT